MNRKKVVSLTVAVTAGLGALLTAEAVQAFNFGDMMNPGRWFGDRDRDRYYDGYRGYGWGGPYGGYGGPGAWGGGPYGYGGGPWGGYGPYGGGWGGYPGYGPGSTIVVTPQGGGASDKQPAPRLPE